MPDQRCANVSHGQFVFTKGRRPYIARADRIWNSASASAIVPSHAFMAGSDGKNSDVMRRPVG